MLVFFISPISQFIISKLIFLFPYFFFFLVLLLLSNAKQVAAWYILRLGFEHFAYKGLETGDRDYCSHVVRQKDIYLVFTSPLNPLKDDPIAQRIAYTGDAVKDVAFAVADVQALYEKAVGRGAKSIMKPTTTKDDGGEVTIATVQTVKTQSNKHSFSLFI